MKWSSKVGTAAVGSVLALGATVLGAAPASAQEPYECAEKSFCIYDGADGTGESFPVVIKWEGGFKLAPSGWNDRASSYRNNTGYTRWLYTGSSETCWAHLGTIAPGEQGNLVGAANDNVDMVANVEYTRLCP